MTAGLWSPGWVQPSAVSPHTSDAMDDVRTMRVMPPLFGLDHWWGWQEHTLALILSRRPDGTPMYRTIVVIICRQNGKTTLLYAVCWIYLAAGYTILFTLHERQKAREKWEEIAVALSSAAPARYAVSRRQGAERITDRTTGGAFILATPDDAGGRSETAEIVIVDEAAFISPRFLKAARATTLTRPEAQIILISSGGTETSEDLARSREAAHEQLPAPIERRTTGIIEYSAKLTPGVGKLDVSDESLWERCIPTLDLPGGARREGLRDELDNLPPADFAREFLSVWSGNPVEHPIGADLWETCLADEMPPRDQLINVVLAVDTDPDQTVTTITVAARHRESEEMWAAVAASAAGTGWVEADLVELARKWKPIKITVDALSPASGISERLRRAGRSVDLVSAATMARSCSHLVTALRAKQLRVVRDDELTAAALGAVRRPLGDTGWAFKRRHGTLTNITPVVSLAIGVFCAYNRTSRLTAKDTPADADETP